MFQPMSLFRPVIFASACLVLSACGSDSPVDAGDGGPDGSLGSGDPHELVVTAPDTLLDALGASTTWNVSTVDETGAPAGIGDYSWTLSTTDVVGLSTSGGGDARASIWSIGNGTVTVTATDRATGLSTSRDLVVEQRLAQLVSPTGRRMMEFAGDTLTMAVRPADRLGNAMSNAAVAWRSNHPAVAQVDDIGVITAVAFGSADIVAAAAGLEQLVTVEVAGDRYFLNGDTPLRYELDLPPGPGPFPAVVWVHGSGEMTRASQKGATDPLVPEGVAVLRYDKRGVGESGGIYFGIGPGNAQNGLGLLASDASAAVDFLAHFPEIDMSRVGLAANSQGGWISPLAASMNPEIDFMLIWSGPTVSVGLEIFYSNLTDAGGTLDAAYAQLDGFSGAPGYEPMPILQTLQIPSLWLFGQEDRSIPVRRDLQNMDILQGAGLPFDYIVYSNAGHDLRDLDSRQFNDIWGDWVEWLKQKGFL